MINNRKEQERAELHSTIWKIATDLRGSVDGWDFKQYVLGMLFYRYISENLTNYINHGERDTGNTSFNYAELSDQKAEQAREDLVATKGFFMLPSELFENVRRRAANDENLNETLEKVFKNIEASAQGSASEKQLAQLVLLKVRAISSASSFFSTPISLIGQEDSGHSVCLEYTVHNTGVTGNLKTTIYRIGCAAINHAAGVAVIPVPLYANPFGLCQHRSGGIIKIYGPRKNSGQQVPIRGLSECIRPRV
jgi:hypothetical protein